MTKDEFRGWKNSPVTEGLFSALSEEMEKYAANLIMDTTGSVAIDQYRKGVIAGLKATVEWEPEFSDEV